MDPIKSALLDYVRHLPGGIVRADNVCYLYFAGCSGVPCLVSTAGNCASVDDFFEGYVTVRGWMLMWSHLRCGLSSARLALDAVRWDSRQVIFLSQCAICGDKKKYTDQLCPTCLHHRCMGSVMFVLRRTLCEDVVHIIFYFLADLNGWIQ
jgi:hypothetical protein